MVGHVDQHPVGNYRRDWKKDFNKAAASSANTPVLMVALG